MEIDFLENNDELTEKIIKRLALTFNEIIKNNEIKYEENIYFIEKEIPEISIEKYLLRISKYINPSYSLFVILPYIMDKIILNKDYNIKLNKYIIHYIIITSILIISKQYEDNIYNNKFYSQVGGISLKTLNKYEILALEIIDYDLSMSLDIYEKYKHHLLKTA
jgi:hypothetical protein